VELFIMAATFAAMVLLYTLFAKFVPIIAIWELKAGLPARLEPSALAEAELLNTRLGSQSLTHSMEPYPPASSTGGALGGGQS
jgi:hypothetical protein